MVVAGATACGGGDGGPAVASCEAVCDLQGSSSGCSNVDNYVNLCKLGCDALIPRLSSDCQAKALAQYDCMKTLSYKCSGAGVPAQPTDSQPCQDKITAYMPCIQGTP